MESNFIEDLRRKYRLGNIVIKLIYINVLVFFSLLIVDFSFKIIGNESFSTIELFSLSSTQELVFHPWQIFTYSWLHGNIFHLLVNMIFLYFVGQMFLQQFQDKNLITFYLFGGISGGFFFLLLQNLFNYSSDSLVGASASIYAVFFALVAYNPKKQVQLFFIPSPFPLLYIGYFFIAFDVYNIITNSNAGGSVSHLGGIVFGYLYMKQFEKGNDFLGKFILKLEKKFLNQLKKNQYTSSKRTRGSKQKNDYNFNQEKVEKQKKIDVILDKISRSGYESLSKEEKDFLFREGR